MDISSWTKHSLNVLPLLVLCAVISQTLGSSPLTTTDKTTTVFTSSPRQTAAPSSTTTRASVTVVKSSQGVSRGNGSMFACQACGSHCCDPKVSFCDYLAEVCVFEDKINWCKGNIDHYCHKPQVCVEDWDPPHCEQPLSTMTKCEWNNCEENQTCCNNVCCIPGAGCKDGTCSVCLECGGDCCDQHEYCVEQHNEWFPGIIPGQHECIDKDRTHVCEANVSSTNKSVGDSYVLIRGNNVCIKPKKCCATGCCGLTGSYADSYNTDDNSSTGTIGWYVGVPMFVFSVLVSIGCILSRRYARQKTTLQSLINNMFVNQGSTGESEAQDL